MPIAMPTPNSVRYFRGALKFLERAGRFESTSGWLVRRKSHLGLVDCVWGAGKGFEQFLRGTCEANTVERTGLGDLLSRIDDLDTE